jgi:hypothetical protein
MMFRDAQLPEDEAWQAMASDLRETKEARNQLKKENACVILPLRLKIANFCSGN